MPDILKPIILREGSYTPGDVRKLKHTAGVSEVRDIYENALRELFEVMHPDQKHIADYESVRSAFVAERTARKAAGDWILFPWSGKLIHTVNEKEYHLLRTHRNRNIITPEEQKRLLDFTVAVAGLSIGGNMAVSIAGCGISNVMKIADGDVIEPTNLNRLWGGVPSLYERKADMVSRQIYEMNPYARLAIFPHMITDASLSDFVSSDPRPDVIFEEIDDFEMKIKIRLAAREARIPVIMLTNLGDRVLIDIERYDIDEKLPVFNGLIGDLDTEILSEPITEERKKKYAQQIVGPENIPERVIHSVQQIGVTLAGRPQVMSTVMIGAGIAALLARKLALGEPLRSGRRLIKFDDVGYV